MRLLYLTSSMDVGGVETNLVGLSSELRRRGHELVVVSSGGTLVKELEALRVRHVRLGISLRRPVALLRSAVRVRRLISHGSFDVVHALSAAANVATLLVPRSHDATLFVTSPMGLQNSDREKPVTTILRNWLLTLAADRVLLISPKIRRSIEALPGHPDRLVDCDMIGIDLEHFRCDSASGDALRRELRIPLTAPLVATIGALHRRKSHDLFLAAAADVTRDMPSARYLVVGEGPERRVLLALASELGLDEAVVFAGQRRDIPSVLAASDVYVKPGVVEGFIGVTVLEAMAAGRPVVAFDTVDVRTAIAPDETGLIVPRGDTRALAAAIVRLLRDRDLAERIGTRARELVRERFSLAPVAERLESVYRHELARKREAAKGRKWS